jgi:hypothetical protein
MRKNLEYELNCARKKSEMDYKPVFDRTTFRYTV